jgi:PPOX class probable F420-dependent enzyme
MTENIVSAFAGLQGHDFIALTTFRKTGVPVVTPVWFVLRDEKVVVFTGRTSGKVKRLRNNPRVELAPSDFNGRPLGATITGSARFIPENEWPENEHAFKKKYKAQFSFFGFVGRMRKNADRIFLEISPV